MTQKPQDMPQEIWAMKTGVGYGDWVQPKMGVERSRYILASPKEDVERALEEMPELRNNYTQEDALEWLGKVEAWFRLNSETIRRVLMANAGRG